MLWLTLGLCPGSFQVSASSQKPNAPSREAPLSASLTDPLPWISSFPPDSSQPLFPTDGACLFPPAPSLFSALTLTCCFPPARWCCHSHIFTALPACPPPPLPTRCFERARGHFCVQVQWGTGQLPADASTPLWGQNTSRVPASPTPGGSLRSRWIFLPILTQ